MAAGTDILEWRGRTVVDRDGQKIGKLDEIYLDERTREPEWGLVNTGLFGTKKSFVPLKGADAGGDDVRVSYDKDQVKDAPKVDVDQELSVQEENALYQHYGFDYSDGGTGARDRGLATGETGVRDRDRDLTGDRDLTDDRDVTGRGTGDRDRDRDIQGGGAMTRSEEELEVGTTQREAGRARLRKYVVTEDVETTVPVRREEVRVEREPITDANRDAALSGPEITESEHEVTLHTEEPVVEKQTVPKERIRLEKDVETDEEQVSETVRKERVETDRDV